MLEQNSVIEELLYEIHWLLSIPGPPLLYIAGADTLCFACCRQL